MMKHSIASLFAVLALCSQMSFAADSAKTEQAVKGEEDGESGADTHRHVGPQLDPGRPPEQRREQGDGDIDEVRNRPRAQIPQRRRDQQRGKSGQQQFGK